MDSAPLPPHERTWRHPSEIGPTTVDVDRGSAGRGLALVGGAMALALVATMAITLTPSASTSTPIAITASTTPSIGRSVRQAASTAVAAAEALRSTPLAGVSAVPAAIADVPAVAFASTATAESTAVLPDLDDDVTVLTEQFAYAVSWRDVTRLDITGDAIVVDESGAVVAHIAQGRLIVSHDLLVGATLTLD